MVRLGIPDVSESGVSEAVGPARRRGHASTPAIAMPAIDRQLGAGARTTHRDLDRAVKARETRRSSNGDRARRQPMRPILAILCIGLLAEAILPWTMLWMSDEFLFDMPTWSPWVVFGGPLVLSLLAVLAYSASNCAASAVH